nr:hypothetical protein [Angustibacter aerolatus]
MRVQTSGRDAELEAEPARDAAPPGAADARTRPARARPLDVAARVALRPDVRDRLRRRRRGAWPGT